MSTVVKNPGACKKRRGLWTPEDAVTDLWLDADDATTFTTVGNDVVEWLDKSGNGNHATTSLGVTTPTTNVAQIGGLNTLLFDGGDLLKTNLSASAASQSVFAVIERNNSGNLTIIGSNANGGRQLRINNGSYNLGFNIQNQSNLGNSNTAIAANTPAIVGMTYNTSDINFYLNGSADGTSTTPVALTASRTSMIGYNGSSNTEGFKGKIGEIIVVDGIVSLEDRQRLKGYLAHKWGLTGSLPTTHPYKTNPP